MARTIDDRLRRLETRRKGTDPVAFNRLNESARLEVLAKSLQAEGWQRRASGQSYTRYAVGAMDQVSPEYTQKSLDTAERVAKILREGLTGSSVTTELQGSVPLNVHIRGVSDVDLLALETSFFTYDVAGIAARQGRYTNPTARTSLGVLSGLRKEAEELLTRRYWGATVDCQGAKAISLEGGSLERPVDVVPSHWWNRADYQASGQQHDRGVTILNKKVPMTIDNTPFLHIKRVTDQDGLVFGGLKKAIRLVKTVKSDAENESTAAKLPSYDIAALLYHANAERLRLGAWYELAILAEAQRFFDWCYRNKEEAKRLRTPDGLRCILDSEDKIDGLTTISVELDDLAKRVAAERLGRNPDSVPWEVVDTTLRSSVVPAAA